MAFTDINQLNGLFKEVYGDDIINLVPDASKFTKLVPFTQKEKENGNFYHQPVILSYEHGFTYAAAGSGAFTLNTQIPMTMKDAQVVGAQILLRSAISYDAAYRASNSKKAFVETTKLVVDNMMESVAKRLEIQSFYGQVGLCTLASRTNVDATHTTHTVTLSEWAAGMWAGIETAQVDMFQSNLSTKINSNGALTIDSVNLANRTLTFSGIAADITAIDTYVNANPNSAVLFFLGANSAGTFQEMAGIKKILINSGTLFNISAATYTLWKGSSYSAGSAALTFGKIVDAIAEGSNRGLSEDVTVFLNPKAWGNIATDQAALRRYGANYSPAKAQNGQEAVEFYSQSGKVTLVPHIFIKEGDAFVLPLKRIKRLGATDITFRRPGRPDDIFLELTGNAGYELRLYTDQAVFIETPARSVLVTSIVNG